jgi:hypothetical protein
MSPQARPSTCHSRQAWQHVCVPAGRPRAPADDLLHKGAAHGVLDGRLLLAADEVLVHEVLQQHESSSRRHAVQQQQLSHATTRTGAAHTGQTLMLHHPAADW